MCVCLGGGGGKMEQVVGRERERGERDGTYTNKPANRLLLPHSLCVLFVNIR